MTQQKEFCELFRTLLFDSYKSGVIRKNDDKGLTFMQREALLQISRNEGCFMKKIAAVLVVAPPALTRIVDKLEKAEYVVRKQDREEKRAIRLYISKKGKEIINILEGQESETASFICQEMKPGEYEVLTSSVKRLSDIFSKVGKQRVSNSKVVSTGK